MPGPATANEDWNIVGVGSRSRRRTGRRGRLAVLRRCRSGRGCPHRARVGKTDYRAFLYQERALRGSGEDRPGLRFATADSARPSRRSGAPHSLPTNGNKVTLRLWPPSPPPPANENKGHVGGSRRSPPPPANWNTIYVADSRAASPPPANGNKITLRIRRSPPPHPRPLGHRLE